MRTPFDNLPPPSPPPEDAFSSAGHDDPFNRFTDDAFAQPGGWQPSHTPVKAVRGFTQPDADDEDDAFAKAHADALPPPPEDAFAKMMAAGSGAEGFSRPAAAPVGNPNFVERQWVPPPPKEPDDEDGGKKGKKKKDTKKKEEKDAKGKNPYTAANLGATARVAQAAHTGDVSRLKAGDLSAAAKVGVAAAPHVAKAAPHVANAANAANSNASIGAHPERGAW